jgi:hypothetical protein
MADMFDNRIDGLAFSVGSSPGAGQPNQVISNQGPFIFPEGLNDFPYNMSLAFYQFQRGTFGNSVALTGAGSVYLPLPNQMQDRQGVTYATERMGTALGAALNAGTTNAGEGEIAAGISGAATSLVEAGAGVVAGSRGLNNPIGGFGRSAASAADNVGSLFGFKMNPFMTVMFETPAFKEHQFSWKLSPTNKKESEILSKIITTFRYNQLPDASLGGLVLTYPNIVQIMISNTKDNNMFRYAFKPCVIRGLTVNFTPDGQPSFFNSTRAPTSVQLQLDLLEIEMWLQRDLGTATATGGAVVQTLQTWLSGLNPFSGGANKL